jgi:hypothetical protein
MVGTAKEHWRELCDLAAVVDDPKMFAKLARYIKRLLDAEQAPKRRYPAQRG